MTDDTVTGWRTRLLTAWAWFLAHRDYTAPLAGFALGWIVGKVL